MVETARNFVGSYHDPARLPTIEYPDQRQEISENSRNFPMLIFDGEDPMSGLRCVACKICEKECPPQCIYIEVERDARGRAVKHPKVFDLDISVCMSCQICVEVCPFDSIKMDTAFEIAGADRFGELLLDKHRLARSNEYYRSIHPSESDQVDLRLTAGQKKPPSSQPKSSSASPSRLAA